MASPASDLHLADAGDPAMGFDAIYRAHFGFVWRTAQRLGVAPGALDDVVQDVFIVVHRKLSQLQPDTSPRAWLFTILRRVISSRRRAEERSRRAGIVPLDQAREPSAPTPSPHELLSHEQSKALLYALLEPMAAPKRETFILAELEGLTAPEIADALGCNVNTVYSRLRLARAEFERALVRHRMRQEGSEP